MGSNNKKAIKRAARLRNLLGVDLCACGAMHTLKCEGVCRESHRDENGKVNCNELYHVDPRLVNITIKEKEID